MAVPKDFTTSHATNDGMLIMPTYWRISFSKQEKELINSLYNQSSGYTSFMLQFFKALRNDDIHRNSSSELSSKVTSYMLKTVLFHITLPYDLAKWQDDELPDRFRDFVRYLLDALERGVLPSAFWANSSLCKMFSNDDFYKGDKSMNLLSDISEETRQRIFNSVKKCLKHKGFDWMLEYASD